MEKKIDHNTFASVVKFLLMGLIFIAAPVFAEPSHGQRTTLDDFDEAWTIFDENYSYFTYKEIDWDHIRNTYRPSFSGEMDGEEFAQNFKDMLNILHDWHVWVKTPSGEYLGYYEPYETNYPGTLLTRYAGGTGYEKLGNDVIYHAMIDGSIAHIVIDSLSSSSFENITDDDIAALFARYADTDGMIIDIRANNGGNESNAMKFASRFTDREILYGYVKYRIQGQDHDAFGELISKTLVPNENIFYDKPVACLIGKRCMSSAEWFTLMMKNCPNVTIIGDSTRGASANPQEFELRNGVGLGVSSWIAYTDQMQPIEDIGIAPDIWIDPASSYDDERDYVLEKAVEVLRGPSSSGCLVFAPDFSIDVPCMDIGGGRLHVFFQYTGNGFTWQVTDYGFAGDAYDTCISLKNNLSFTLPCIKLDGMELELTFGYTGKGWIWEILF